MGIGLIAVAGVLLLGAGVVILVSSLGKTRGSSATIDQIQTYGYVAEISPTRSTTLTPGTAESDAMSSGVSAA